MMIFIHFGEKLGFRADPRIAWNMVMNNKMFSDVVPSASWLEMGHHFLILFGFWTCKLFFFFFPWEHQIRITGWCFGPFLLFHILGLIIPTDFHIFQRGGSTTNQINYEIVVWLHTFGRWWVWWKWGVPQIKAAIFLDSCRCTGHIPVPPTCSCGFILHSFDSIRSN